MTPPQKGGLGLFDAVFGIPAPPSFTIVCPPGGCPSPSLNNTKHDVFGCAVETSLDVEWARAMAPGANIVLVVAPTNSSDAIDVVEATAISLYPNSIMSQSFGTPEFLIHANNVSVMQAHRNYQAAKAANITVLASAGDFGATTTAPAPPMPFSPRLRPAGHGSGRHTRAPLHTGWHLHRLPHLYTIQLYQWPVRLPRPLRPWQNSSTQLRS